jgi:aubergine-like protein
VLEDIFTNWAKAYYQTNNKKVPNLIILYREGLSPMQAQAQLPKTEIPAMEAMIKTIGERTNTKNYKPEVMIVMVNKKINSRYFMTGRENTQNPNKFTPELFNPDSGCAIAEELAIDNSYEFHLTSQYVTQGTCTPTLFKVAYDTTNMPQEALIQFTFDQCFNYYNWEGAVRVPACLQCADKLSKLVGQYIREDLVQSAVTKKHFFL